MTFDVANCKSLIKCIEKQLIDTHDIHNKNKSDEFASMIKHLNIKPNIDFLCNVVDNITLESFEPLDGINNTKSIDQLLKHINDVFLILTSMESDGELPLYSISLKSTLQWLGCLNKFIDANGKFDMKQVSEYVSDFRTRRYFNATNTKYNVLRQEFDYTIFKVSLHTKSSLQIYFTVKGFIKFCASYTKCKYNKYICLTLINLESKVVHLGNTTEEERKAELNRIKNKITKQSNRVKLLKKHDLEAMVSQLDNTIANVEHDTESKQFETDGCVKLIEEKMNEMKMTESQDLTDVSIEYDCFNTLCQKTPEMCVRIYLVNYDAINRPLNPDISEKTIDLNSATTVKQLPVYISKLAKKYDSYCDASTSNAIISYGDTFGNIINKPSESSFAWYWIFPEAVTKRSLAKHLKSVEAYIHKDIYYDIPFISYSVNVPEKSDDKESKMISAVKPTCKEIVEFFKQYVVDEYTVAKKRKLTTEYDYCEDESANTEFYMFDQASLKKNIENKCNYFRSIYNEQQSHSSRFNRFC